MEYNDCNKILEIEFTDHCFEVLYEMENSVLRFRIDGELKSYYASSEELVVVYLFEWLNEIDVPQQGEFRVKSYYDDVLSADYFADIISDRLDRNVSEYNHS